MKAQQYFITRLLTVPGGKIFLDVFSKFGVNNKLRIKKPNLNHILQERGGRLTCREDMRCVVILRLRHRFHVQALGPCFESLLPSCIFCYVLKEPEKQSDLVEWKHPNIVRPVLSHLACIFHRVGQTPAFASNNWLHTRSQICIQAELRTSKVRPNPSDLPMLSHAVVVKKSTKRTDDLTQLFLLQFKEDLL